MGEVVVGLSQKLAVTSYKLSGRPYTGVGDDGLDRYATTGRGAALWLADASRARFNQQRSLRQKYDYVDGVRVLASDGKPLLVPIGSSVSRHTHAQARLLFPHLAAVPAMVLHFQSRDEDKSWWAAIKRRSTNLARGRRVGAMPGFRSRHRSNATFGCFARNGKNTVAALVKTGKRSGLVSIGGRNPAGKTVEDYGQSWRISLRVRLPKKFIRREFTSVLVNVTTGHLVLVNAPLPIERVNTGAVVGIDVGVKVNIATSDGQMLNPPDTTNLVRRRKTAQRSMNRSRLAAKFENRNFWDSTRYQNRKAEAARLSGRITRIRTDWRHKTTTSLVRTYDYIAIENLQLAQMSRSAAGSTAHPGKNVRAKAGLNRGLANLAAGTIFAQLKYKTALAGVHLVEVAPQHTSQRCHQCGHIAAENRETQAVFCCIRCGYTGNADYNASVNILTRALGQWGGIHPKRIRGYKTDTSQLVPAIPA